MLKIILVLITMMIATWSLLSFLDTLNFTSWGVSVLILVVAILTAESYVNNEMRRNAATREIQDLLNKKFKECEKVRDNAN